MIDLNIILTILVGLGLGTVYNVYFGEKDKKKKREEGRKPAAKKAAPKKRFRTTPKKIGKKEKEFNEIKNRLKNEDDVMEFYKQFRKSFIHYDIVVSDLLHEWNEILGNYEVPKKSTKYEIVKFAEKKLNLKLSKSLSKQELIDRLELKINELSKESKKPDKIKINKIRTKILKRIKFFDL